MIKLIPAIMLCVGLILATNSNAYAVSLNAFGHVTITSLTSIKLYPTSGSGVTHVLVTGKGFHPNDILDLSFTDSQNHVFKLGKILVNNHGGFTKHIIIIKKVAIGNGIISVKHGTIVLATAVFTVKADHHHHGDD